MGGGGAKLPETNVFIAGSKNLKSPAVTEHVQSKLNSLLTAGKKTSLDEKSLEILS